MKRRLLGIVPVLFVLPFVWSCSEDTAGSPSSSGVFGGTSDSGSNEGVECTHPGAGKPLGGNRCECSTTRNIVGDWSGKRTCREGTSCPTRDADEALSFKQTGIRIRGESATFSLTGALCGDVIVWGGGPKDKSSVECGQFRFTDDTHYVGDSCSAAFDNDCFRTFANGCPSQKAQCTSTGAKTPEATVAIVKDICK